MRIVDRRIRIWIAALILLCAGSLWLQFKQIDRTLPYPRNVDEGLVAGPAARILTAGTLHPGTFNDPSLPKYLAAAGMAVGFLRGATQLQILRIDTIGPQGFPYYHTPGTMRVARRLFAFLSIVTLAATAIAAWHAFREPAAIFLSPLVLAMSHLFFDHSWGYLNVEIVGTCFVVLAVAACLQGTRQPSMHWSAIVPAVFAGLAAGSSYRLVVVIAPILLAIGMYFTAGRRLWPWLAAIMTMTVTFLIVVPYSVIDIPAFLNGIASEAFHSASAHTGSDGDPGLPQLLYYGGQFVAELGVATAAVAVLGACACCIADWRRSAVLVAFPIAVLWLLASQRVHFPRNMLSLLPIVAMFAAYGIIAVRRWALDLAARREWSSFRLKRLDVVVTVLLVATAVPLWHLRDHLRDRTDSRNRAQAWIEMRIPPDWTIVVPSQLGFDTRALEAKGAHILVADVHAADDLGRLNDVQGPAVALVPRWGRDPGFSEQQSPDAMNAVTRDWRFLESFGTNPVLVNRSPSTPSGDPAFGVAIVGRQHVVPR